MTSGPGNALNGAFKGAGQDAPSASPKDAPKDVNAVPKEASQDLGAERSAPRQGVDNPDLQSHLAAHGKEAITKGSKSFALASRVFGAQMQADVQMLYAWCRHCDDVIDGQSLGEDAPDADLSPEEQARRLQALKRDTVRALQGETLGVAAFDGFGAVARRHQIPERYAMDLLAGFAMDVEGRSYETFDDALSYCYGVAGVVGVMMAIVMGVAHDDEATLDRACDLGLGFQLTNICRDVIDDAKAGRVYLPAALLKAYGVDPSAEGVLARESRAALAGAVGAVLGVADQYYASATIGLRRLPPRAAGAIAAARNIYRDIGRIVEQRGQNAWDQRVHTSAARKVQLALSGLATGAPQALFMRSLAGPARADGLWQRPTM